MDGNTSPKERRYRGRLFVGFHLDEGYVCGVTVSIDPYQAAFRLGDWLHEGMVLMLGPEYRGPWRSYLEGEPAPYPVPMQAWTERLIPAIARDAYVSRTLAKKTVVDGLEERVGVGKILLPELAKLSQMRDLLSRLCGPSGADGRRTARATRRRAHSATEGSLSGESRSAALPHGVQARR